MHRGPPTTARATGGRYHATAGGQGNPGRPDYSRKAALPPAPGQFKTFHQLRLWAGERFPRATLVTTGIDLKGWNRIAPALDRLAAEWPGVAAELEWITTRHALWEDDPRRTITAADSTFGEKIAFNPFYFSSPRTMARVLKEGEKYGAYPKGARAAGEWYFISHEWGHLVNAWLRRRDRQRWLRLTGLFRTEAGDPESAFEPTKAAPISEYATSRIADAFAEAFSVLQWQSVGTRADILEQFSRILRGES